MMKKIRRMTAALLAVLLWIVAATSHTAALSIKIPDEGMLIYSQDFDDWGDTDWQISPPIALGMRRLTVAEDRAYSESDALFALREGRLYFDNYDAPGETVTHGGTRGADAYYTIDPLSSEFMRMAWCGDYTLQYDLCYTNAESPSRYAVILTEYSEREQAYNSFHFRVNGRGNHQCYFYGAWKDYSFYDPATDLNPSADAADGSEGTPILRKLLGADAEVDMEKMNFLNIPLTIRQVWDPEMGHSVWMKTAEMVDFVKVAEPSIQADGPMYVGWEGYAVVFKIGGAVEGYIDNVLLWIGDEDTPSPKREPYAAYYERSLNWSNIWKELYGNKS